ncbi:2Fe-2S iron-sulfur cluster-binding protein [Massilia endophytica]|uniref:2Fe-2S iron-sulfur cluster-binding protein n=1 Tax=Massilia endophytica TaxID=2899220 RepID=UPI001E2FA29D|nr:2Fe-2S iron-sulfur cluster-binding protein [Massilia endophytica]UGQ48804.1 (2Fe-2S)-binding protein [Massilia endophytica]
MIQPDSSCAVTVNGISVRVPPGASVAAALVAAGTLCTRRSVTGQMRFAFCGIGQCQECRVSIDGQPHRLACRTSCKEGMHIVTGGEG